MPDKLTVMVSWDDEADVWVAISEDVEGLATEASTLEALVRKLELMVPELLELNHGDRPSALPTSFDLVTTLPLQHTI